MSYLLKNYNRKKISFKKGIGTYLYSTNGSKYLDACIQNKIQQKLDIEYIIVDGYSTDKSHEIIKKYNFVNLIIKKDKNMYEAINSGIHQSNHEIVTYINVDDSYNNDVLEYGCEPLPQYNCHNILPLGLSHNP